MNYTNDLAGYIENMKDIVAQLELSGDDDMILAAKFAVKTAEVFKAKGEDSK